MPLERIRQKVASRGVYTRRVLGNLAIVFGLTGASLSVGMVGYHRLGEPMDWYDAFANAAMILSGMGPLSDLKTPAGKVFEGAYALYSGLFLLVAAGLVLGPVAHRFLHRMHMAEEDEG